MVSSKSTLTEILDFFASVKLALIILIAIAIAAIGGTIIPQNLNPEQYLQEYGTQLFTFLSYLDMFDMYHSWWFNLLLGALIFNLTACTIKRLPKTIKMAKSVNPEKVKLDFLKKQAFSDSGLKKGSPENALPEIKALFKKKFAAPREKKTNWGTLLYAEKGAFSRFGVYIVHFSLFFIVAGAVTGGAYGYSAFININEGDTISKVVGRKPAGLIDLPFSVRLDDFRVEYYDTGAPSEYRSDVTVIDNGREVQKAVVLVNHPLRYKGVTFYQSTFGQRTQDDVTLEFKTAERDPVLVKAAAGHAHELPDGLGGIQLLEFQENLMDIGPAVKILVQPSAGKAYTEWIFKNRPDFLPAPEGPLFFALKDYNAVYYSGFQVNKDPGTPLIWIGFTLMLVGFVWTFFFSHQRIYVGIVTNGKKNKIVVAGSTHRNQGSFKIKFDELTSAIFGRSASGDN